MQILVDKREKRPLWEKPNKNHEVEFTCLKTGDYSIKGLENEFAIERKSLSDLFGSLGKGHKRFKREIARGLQMEYFAIVIDGTYDHILNKDFDGAEFSKMRGYVITSILFTLHIKYKILR